MGLFVPVKHTKTRVHRPRQQCSAHQVSRSAVRAFERRSFPIGLVALIRARARRLAAFAKRCTVQLERPRIRLAGMNLESRRRDNSYGRMLERMAVEKDDRAGPTTN